MSTVLQRVRGLGTCSPSLLSDERGGNDEAFERAVLQTLSPEGVSLQSSNPLEVASLFQRVLEMAASVDKVHGTAKASALEQRRSIILAIVGATPSDNRTLTTILEPMLTATKQWLDDILNGAVGGVDLLLHLLNSIRHFPVTKSAVFSSGMGKAVGSIEKHNICKGSPNEGAIKERVHAVKEAWQNSVKILKGAPEPKDDSPESKKRPIDSTDVSPSTKRAKSSSFSGLLKIVSNGGSKSGQISKLPIPPAAKSMNPTAKADGSVLQPNGLSSAPVTSKKQSNKRVKWADHFGGTLERAKEIEGENHQKKTASNGDVSWTVWEKRDRMREKELLAKAKKAKLSDNDDDTLGDLLGPGLKMKQTAPWRQPALLPERSDVAKAQLDSKEFQTQTDRTRNLAEALYQSESEVPMSPAPMSDVEQALDMTSQSSAVVATIPFFVPQTPAPAPAVAPAPVPVAPPVAAPTFQVPPPPPAPLPTMSGASSEFVQSLGLPLFLVGSNTQALQTLANSPGLLNTFVDANGMYDQHRLVNLVQTLSQSMPPPSHPAPQPQQPAVHFQQQHPYAPTASTTAFAPTPSAAPFGQQTYGNPAKSADTPVSTGYRGDQNLTEANLHISGYGPMTTQTEIVALFSPYVHVTEVVMKGTFSFVNTRDPEGAARAREALNGALLGGKPVRINMAQRKNRDPARSAAYESRITPYSGSSNFSSNTGGGFGSSKASIYGPAAGAAGATAPQQPPPQIQSHGPGPLPNSGEMDISNVRDDRGNPATKNLFVAGYGPGTTELQLREIFGQHANVTGCVLKGSFSFVNTTDREAAVKSRTALMGSVLNGGVLRINFAKETGRLGTSFDLTYNTHTAHTSSRYGPGGQGPRYNG